MDEFNPVLFDPKAHAARKREESPAFCDAYDALDDEFAALAVLLKTRKDAGLTQAEVATKKGGFPARAGTHRIQPRQPQTRPLSLDPAQVRQRLRQAACHSDAVTKRNEHNY